MNEIRYFAFEGIVGAGKSEQSKRFAKRLQHTFPMSEVVWTKEPGGSKTSDAIREVVLNPAYTDMTPVAEQLLYAASRAQTLPTIVKPVLDRGGFVVSDRSVYTSGAFQGYGRGLGIETVWQINMHALDGLWPHAAFFINTDIDVALARCNDKYGDKFESMGRDFFIQCIKGYRHIVNNAPNVFEIDGNKTLEEVEEQIWSYASGLLGLK